MSLPYVCRDCHARYDRLADYDSHICPRWAGFDPPRAPRPPLGVEPRWLHDIGRLHALAGALERYTATVGALSDLPLAKMQEWAKEAYEIASSLRGDHEQG
jgi:hypothetical protein